MSVPSLQIHLVTLLITMIILRHFMWMLHPIFQVLLLGHFT